MRSSATEVLSKLYGQHVDVIHVHGRVLVVAGRGDGPAEPAGEDGAHCAVQSVPDWQMTHLRQRRSFEPGFFGNAPVRVALMAGGVVALVSGVVGMFTVLRGQSFAGHALADVGATGGSGAFLRRDQPAVGFRRHRRGRRRGDGA